MTGPDETRECPFCAETIKARAIKCKQCGSLLTEQARARLVDELARLRSAASPAQSLAAYVPEHLRGAVGRPVEELDGTFLFADISGFTALFEAAAAGGTGGTEMATEALNRCFGQFIEAIESGGGSILKFGGDAILAYVPGGDASCRPAVWISTEILKSIREAGRARIGNKIIRMGVKVAVHRGRGLGVNAPLGGGRLEYVPLGKVFEELAAIEDVSVRGQIVASKAAAHLAGGAWERHAGGFCLLKHFSSRKADSPARPSSGESPLDAEHCRSYVPDAVADRIERLGGAAAWLCEHRFVTPIFTEIRGWVAGAEKVLQGGDPATLVDFLSSTITNLRGEMRIRGGIFARTDIAVEGLKAICLFGVSAVVERQEISAVEAAVRFRDRIGKMRKDVRMGIAAGKSFACLVGTDRRCDFTVIGDVMNTSARLMAAAPWGEIFGLRSMMAKTGGLFRESPCRIVAKGKRLPLEVSLVHGIAPAARTSPAPSGAPMIGRTKEREALMGVMERAKSGSAGRVEIVAEAGLGKTTLLEWAMRRWVGRGGTVWKGSCLPHGSGDAFLPWRSIMGQALDLREGWAEEKILERIKAAGFGSDSGTDGLSSILGLSVKTSDPKLLRRLRADALQKLLRQARAPVLVVIEDLHWADPDSVALLTDMDESRRPAIITARPAYAFGNRGEIERVILAPFTVEETRALAEDILKDRPLATRKVEEIHAKTAGNPLFVSEILRMIAERGDEAQIPDTIGSAILCRADRLAEFDRKILRAATVIGPMFEPELLYELPAMGGSREEIGRALQTLTAAEFVEPAGADFAFHHETIRNAVYDSMSHRLRANLHRWIGHLGERRGKEPWWLAHHFEAGGDQDRAVLYHERAATAAARARVHESVRFHSGRALDILGRPVDAATNTRAGLLRRLRAKALKQLGRYREAIRDYSPSLNASNRIDAIDAANFISSCQRLMGRHRESLRTGRRALRLARGCEHGATAQEKEILNTLSTTYWYLGEYKKCIELGEEAYALECRTSAEPAGNGLFLVGNALVKLANIQEARRPFQILLDIAEKRGHAAGIAYAMHGMGYCDILAGRFEQALFCHRRGFEIRKKLGEPRALAYSALNLAECYVEMGLAQPALPFLAHGEESVNQIEDGNLRVDLERIFGLLELSRGHPLQALGRFQKTLALARKLGFFEMQVKALVGASRCFLSLNEPPAARRWARRAAGHAGRVGMEDLAIWSAGVELLSNAGRGQMRASKRRSLVERALAADLKPLALRMSIMFAAGDDGGHEFRQQAASVLNQMMDDMTDPELKRKLTLRWTAELG